LWALAVLGVPALRADKVVHLLGKLFDIHLSSAPLTLWEIAKHPVTQWREGLGVRGNKKTAHQVWEPFVAC
jgi:hypothetical protein